MVHRWVRQIGALNASAFSSVQKELSQNRQMQNEAIHTHMVIHAQTNRKLDQILSHMASLGLNELEEHDECSILEQIDLESIALPLILMKELLFDIAFAVAFDAVQGEMAKGEAGWIWSEFNTLPTPSEAASASSARTTLPLHLEKFYRCDRQTIGDSPTWRASRRRRDSPTEDDDALNVIPPFKRSHHTRELAKLTHYSLLTIELDHSVIGET